MPLILLTDLLRIKQMTRPVIPFVDSAPSLCKWVNRLTALAHHIRERAFTGKAPVFRYIG